MKNIFTVIYFICISVMTFGSGGSETSEIRILYSSSLNGNLDGCTCISVPKAGLVKRGYYLRNEDLSNTLLVEAGDIFDVYSDPFLHNIILEAYRELAYDVIAVGDQEFTEGIPFLLDKNNEYPFLANNLSVNGSYIWKDPYHRKIKKIDIEVFSIVEPEVFLFYPDDIKDNISAENTSGFMSGKASADKLTVVIYHGRYNGAEKLASSVKNIDIIILGHEQLLLEPQKKGNTWIVSPGDNGNYLGELIVSISGKGVTKVSNTFRYFSYEDDTDDIIILEMIKKYYNSLKAKTKS